VSHDSSFLNEFVDNIIHIHNKTLNQYKGDYETYLKVRASNRRSKAKAHDAAIKKQTKLKDFIQKNRNSRASNQVHSRQLMLEKLDEIELDVDDASLKFAFPDCGGLGPNPLKFYDANFGYTNDCMIFNKLDFAIDTDSRIALVGRNGVGKSTLMNLMLGDLEPTSGFIERDRHMRVARFHQHHVDQLNMSQTVMEYMKERFSSAKDQEIRNHVAKFGLTGSLALQSINTLSGGQKSRVAFAELAWLKPHILFLDEPSNHLDLETIESLAKALADFDGGVVVITHNQYLVQLVCTEIWVVGHKAVKPFEGDFREYKQAVAKELGYTAV